MDRPVVDIIVAGGAARLEPVELAGESLEAEAAFERRVPILTGGRGRRRFDLIPEQLYRLERDPATGRPYYATYAGLIPAVAKHLRARGLEPRMRVHPAGLPEFQPDFTWLERANITLRPGQERMLAVILKYERAQLSGITALGKSFLVRLLAHCYPQPLCRMVVAAPSLGLLHAYLRELRADFPLGEVGQLGQGRREVDARIVVSTFDSLPRVRAERTNILILDEVHACGTANRLDTLSRFVRSRVYGLTASANCRTDGADKAVEAICGPVMTRVTYREAVADGYVPEVDTYFYRCDTPPSSLENPVARKRHLVWRNGFRNDTVAGVCRHWEKVLRERDGTEPQILVLVATIEHMFHLGRLLPEYVPLHDHIDPGLRRRLQGLGLIPPGYRVPTTMEKLRTLREFVDGRIRKAIAQTQAGTGTDTRCLDVLVRADGGSSEVSNIQYRGRVMRGDRGIYADILDVGDPRLAAAAQARLRSARKSGMRVRIVDLWDGHRIVAPT
jgi:superfamily II DNA or RNA helicase